MRRPLSILVSALALACSLVGCVSAGAGEADVELGGGEWRFEPLAPAQDVELIAGIQGGFHVWTSMRADGLDPERVTLRLVTEPEDGSRPSELSEVRIDMSWDEEAQGLFFVGWPAILGEPACLVDRPLRIALTLTDRHGVRGADERVVVPRASEATRALLPPCGD